MRIIIIMLSCLLLSFTAGAQWQWGISGADALESYGSAVVTDDSGNIYVTGSYTDGFTIGSTVLSCTGSYTDLFVAKFDPSGQLLWINGEGGPQPDQAYSISLDSDNNIYVCGYYTDSAIIGPDTYYSNGGEDILIVKYDNQGNLAWVRSYGGPGNDRAFQLGVSMTGQLYITGSFVQSMTVGTNTLTSPNYQKTFLIKLDNEGDVQWAKSTSGTSNFGTNIVVCDNEFYISGNTGSSTLYFDAIALSNVNVFLAKYDTMGNALWATGVKAMDNYPLRGNVVVADTLGNVYLSGYSYEDQNYQFENFILQDHHAYVAKYTEQGNFIWAKGISSYNIDDVSGATTDGQNIYIAGFLSHYGVFNGDTIFTNGWEDIWITKIDSSGSHQWSEIAGGAGNESAQDLTVNDDGTIITTGYIASANVQFGQSTVSTAGGQDMFLAKLTQPTSVPGIYKRNKQLIIYPTPANDELYIKGVQQNSSYRITSVTGAIMKVGNLHKGINRIEITQLASGMYLLHAGNEVHKIVKE